MQFKDVFKVMRSYISILLSLKILQGIYQESTTEKPLSTYWERGYEFYCPSNYLAEDSEI